MPNDCIICHKPLPSYFEGDMCSAKCRKKKSRDRQMAPQRAHAIAFEIDAIGRTIRLNKLDAKEAETLLYIIWESTSNLIKQVRAIGGDKQSQEDD